MSNKISKKAKLSSDKQTSVNNRKPTMMPKSVRKPISQTRQDISDWRHAQHLATAMRDPKPYLLQDILMNIANDPLVASQINNRKEQSISADYEMITDDDKVDEKLTKILRAISVVPDILSYILDSENFNNSLIELSSENGRKRVDLIPRRNIDAINGRYYPDTSLNNYITYREASEYGKWLLEFNADHMGTLNKAVPQVLFKKFAQTCWSMLCEIYGIPPRVLKTNTQDPGMLDRADNMMRDIGAAAYFIIDTNEEFEFANSVNTNGDVYRNLIGVCDNYISLLFSGAIIGQDTKNGNESKEKISIKILERLVDSDKRMVEMYMNSVVIPALQQIGWIPTTSSRFRFAVAEDKEKLFEMTVKMLPYMEVEPKWVKEKFGIEVMGVRNQAGANFQ